MSDGILGRKTRQEGEDICNHGVKLAVSPGVILASLNNLFNLNNEGRGLDG